MLLTLAAPLLVASTLLTAAFLPSLGELVGLWTDNCEPDHIHHPHLCPLHPSAPIQGGAQWLGIVGAIWAGVLVVKGGLACRRLYRSSLRPDRVLPLDDLPLDMQHRVQRAKQQLGLPVCIVRDPLPIAVLTGIRSPCIVLSITILELLTTDELDAVIQHEYAHYERRDLAIGWLVEVLAWGHLPGVGAWLKRAFALDVEAACDERAAAVLGSGLSGASALVRLERWALTTRRALKEPSGISLGIAGTGGPVPVEQRIEGLLRWSPGIPAPLPFSVLVWGPVGIVVGSVLGLSEPVHHVMESLLGQLSG